MSEQNTQETSFEEAWNSGDEAQPPVNDVVQAAQKAAQEQEAEFSQAFAEALAKDGELTSAEQKPAETSAKQGEEIEPSAERHPAEKQPTLDKNQDA